MDLLPTFKNYENCFFLEVDHMYHYEHNIYQLNSELKGLKSCYAWNDSSKYQPPPKKYRKKKKAVSCLLESATLNTNKRVI